MGYGMGENRKAATKSMKNPYFVILYFESLDWTRTNQKTIFTLIKMAVHKLIRYVAKK